MTSNKNRPSTDRKKTAQQTKRGKFDFWTAGILIVSTIAMFAYLEAPTWERHLIATNGIDGQATIESFAKHKNAKGTTRRYSITAKLQLTDGVSQPTEILVDRDNYHKLKKKFEKGETEKEKLSKSISETTGYQIMLSIQNPRYDTLIPIRYLKTAPSISTLPYQSYWEHTDMLIGVFVMIGFCLTWLCVEAYKRYIISYRKEL